MNFLLSIQHLQNNRYYRPSVTTGAGSVPTPIIQGVPAIFHLHWLIEPRIQSSTVPNSSQETLSNIDNATTDRLLNQNKTRCHQQLQASGIKVSRKSLSLFVV